MSFLLNLNFFATILTAGCVSFAASNFGIKLGRLTSFKNNSGFKYISESNNSKNLYDDIAKVAAQEKGAPEWAKTKEKLEKHCKSYQYSLRYWNETSKYCLIKNNVRQRLIEQGYTLKDSNTTLENTTSGSSTTETIKCSDIFDYYADEKLDSIGYLYGKSKCVNIPSSTTSGNAS